MVPRAANGSDAEPLDGDGVELAVAMAGDQHLGAVARLVPDERCQEMLAVPEGEDRRHLRLDDVVDIRRIIGEAVGEPNQAQVLGREKPNGALEPAATQHITDEMFQVESFASYFAS